MKSFICQTVIMRSRIIEITGFYGSLEIGAWKDLDWRMAQGWSWKRRKHLRVDLKRKDKGFDFMQIRELLGFGGIGGVDQERMEIMQVYGNYEGIICIHF